MCSPTLTRLGSRVHNVRPFLGGVRRGSGSWPACAAPRPARGGGGSAAARLCTCSPLRFVVVRKCNYFEFLNFSMAPTRISSIFFLIFLRPHSTPSPGSTGEERANLGTSGTGGLPSVAPLGAASALHRRRPAPHPPPRGKGARHSLGMPGRWKIFQRFVANRNCVLSSVDR